MPVTFKGKGSYPAKKLPVLNNGLCRQHYLKIYRMIAPFKREIVIFILILNLITFTDFIPYQICNICVQFLYKLVNIVTINM